VDRQSRGAPEIGINLGAQLGHPAVEMLNLEKDCELISKHPDVPDERQLGRPGHPMRIEAAGHEARSED